MSKHSCCICGRAYERGKGFRVRTSAPKWNVEPYIYCRFCFDKLANEVMGTAEADGKLDDEAKEGG